MAVNVAVCRSAGPVCAGGNVIRAKKKAPAAKPLSGRARKDQVIVRAREIAVSGSCLNFNAVLAKLKPDDAATLKLWATANDRDEIDRLCDRALAPRRRTRKS